MGVKEIRGRSLPGRNEEPSPDAPSQLVSGKEGAKAAAQQQQQSAFERLQRQPQKPKGPKGQHGVGPNPLDESEFETSAHAPLRSDDHAELPAGMDVLDYGGGDAGSGGEQERDEEDGLDDGEEPASDPLWNDQFEAEAEAARAAAGSVDALEDELPERYDPLFGDRDDATPPPQALAPSEFPSAEPLPGAPHAPFEVKEPVVEPAAKPSEFRSLLAATPTPVEMKAVETVRATPRARADTPIAGEVPAAPVATARPRQPPAPDHPAEPPHPPPAVVTPRPKLPPAAIPTDYRADPPLEPPRSSPAAQTSIEVPVSAPSAPPPRAQTARPSGPQQKLRPRVPITAGPTETHASSDTDEHTLPPPEPKLRPRIPIGASPTLPGSPTIEVPLVMPTATMEVAAIDDTGPSPTIEFEALGDRQDPSRTVEVPVVPIPPKPRKP